MLSFYQQGKQRIMDEFSEQVAIVTGAASGIGLEISKQLLRRGAKVAIFDVDRENLERQYKDHLDQVRLFTVDITNPDLVEKSVRSVVEKWGRIDVLVNSAGITGKTNIKSHLVDQDDLRRVFEINFMGSFNMAKAILPVMLDQEYGRVLHVASIAGKEGNAGMLAYSASKAAVIGMTKVQGKEYAGTGITVNAMAPAVIRTPLVDAMPEEQVSYMTEKIPMKRCGSLEETADLALYIVSKKNSFTTGFTFDLTGGRATY